MRYRPAVASTSPPGEPRRVNARRSPAARVALWLAAVLIVGVGMVGAGGVAAADPTADDWYRLRVCESGNNYAIDTGNGYYGAYQFDLGTWRSIGGTGLPSQASPATQDALALTLWRQRGWGPWACARILGLQDSPVSAAPVTPAPVPPAPTGNLETIAQTGRYIVIQGWALDPNSPGTSIQLHVYVNSTGNVFTANKPRADVDAALGVGGDHGFSESIELPAGADQVCVYAIGVNWPNNTALGCRTVVAPAAPIGHWDGVQSTGYMASFAGWAVDLNSPDTSIQVHAYLNGGGTALTADGSRPDVNAVGIGGNHGFSSSLPLAVGANQLCLYAIGVSWPNNTTLGCGTIQGPPLLTGQVDSVTPAGASAVVSGWSVDGRAPSASNDVHIYVNGAGYAVTANAARPDVNAAFGIAGNHGFSMSVPLQNGANNICSYAFTTAVDASVTLACRNLDFNGAAARAQRMIAPEAQAQAAEAAPANQAAEAAPEVGPAAESIDADSAPASVPVAAAATSGPAVAAPAASAGTTASAASSTSSIETTPAAAVTRSAGKSALSSAGSSSAALSSAASSSAPAVAPGSTLVATPTAPALAAGALDPLVVTNGSAAVTGWIADPKATTTPAHLRIAVNGVLHDVVASSERADVAKTSANSGTPLASTPWGFTDTVPLVKGANEICLYEVDGTGGVSTAPIACRTQQLG